MIANNILIIQRKCLALFCVLHCIRRPLPCSSNGHWNCVIPLSLIIHDAERSFKCCLHSGKKDNAIRFDSKKCRNDCKCQRLRVLLSQLSTYETSLLWGCASAVRLTVDLLRYTGRLIPHTVLSSTPSRSWQLWSVGLVACFKKKKKNSSHPVWTLTLQKKTIDCIFIDCR